jgi:hypothetical protein
MPFIPSTAGGHLTGFDPHGTLGGLDSNGHHKMGMKMDIKNEVDF